MFQQSIISQHIAQISAEEIAQKWAQFQAIFHNADKQANIRASKEEQYQEGFLRDLFVAIFGYTLNPEPNYNLTTEQKNETDSKKADGAILHDGKVIAVIELKGTDTRDLNKIVAQAFGYKNNNANCRYVIISNFQKIRFYIQNTTEFLEFDLFTLNEEQFKLLYLIFKREHLQSGLPEKIKAQSLSVEEAITKQLYADYSAFKRDLFADLIAHNPQHDKLFLFQKAQKLLDRFLFIFFAEDCKLLPPNLCLNILNDWNAAKKLRIQMPLYDYIKQFFGYLNTGDSELNIFAYNGGLFKPNPELDALIISDDVLEKHCRKIAQYDFASQIDVNILGHIFEHSLNEIDEIHAELNGEKVDKKQTKRKKDGVFYTPKYITQYIVQNTVGKLCADKKAEMGIVDVDYTDVKQGTHTKTKQARLKKLEDYREWLLDITICDPACGSGAFLNEALNFLIAEHTLIDEWQSQLAGGSMVYQNIEHAILERNLYGVDINEESVEIAKLSLWLRTAQRHRKLNNLNNNIVCGNSLISDKNVAGAKAFDFQAAFPQVFARGGFDVIIGNPPYVRAELLPENHLAYYREHYQVFNSSGDLFSYFYELGLKLLKPNGLFAFISNTFDKTAAGETLRQFIGQQKKIVDYVDFTEVQIFEGATTYPVILILANEFVENHVFSYTKIPVQMQKNIEIDNAPRVEVAQSSLKVESWAFHSILAAKIMEKICQHQTVKAQFGKCYYGVKTGLNEAFVIDEETKNQLIAENKKSVEIIKPFYEGKDLSKWTNAEIGKYLIATHNGFGQYAPIDVNEYPAIKRYLEPFIEQLTKRYDKGITPYNLRNCAYQNLFEQPKIVWSNLQNGNKFSFESGKYYLNAPACFLPSDNLALLCVLNSKIVWQFLSSICVVRSGGYIEVKPQYFEQIPIPEITPDFQAALTELADKMLQLNRDFQAACTQFERLFCRRFAIEKPSKALLAWHEGTFTDFVDALKKHKIKLSLDDEMKWEDAFNTQHAKVAVLKQSLADTDSEIDKRVFELYGLNEEEITIVQAA